MRTSIFYIWMTKLRIPLHQDPYPWVLWKCSNSDTFQSSVTSETFKINHQCICDAKCPVYLFTFKTSSKYYAGETTDQFRLRWSKYKSNYRYFKRGGPCMQEHLYEHFYSDGHNGFFEDVEITLINKTDGRNPKSRESYWMRTLKTLTPTGLKIEDCVWPNTIYTTYHTI